MYANFSALARAYMQDGSGISTVTATIDGNNATLGACANSLFYRGTPRTGPIPGGRTLFVTATAENGATTTANIAVNVPSGFGTFAEPSNAITYPSHTPLALVITTNTSKTVSSIILYDGTTVLINNLTTFMDAANKIYVWYWEQPEPTAGTHSLRARINYSDLTSTDSYLSVTFADDLPAGLILTPPSNVTFNTPATVPFLVRAWHANGSIERLSLCEGVGEDETELSGGNTRPLRFDWANPTPLGAHTVTAKVLDNEGITTTPGSVTVTIGNPAPTVRITEPGNGAWFVDPATITLAAEALDANGLITGVEFFANGASVGTGTQEGGITWTCDWSGMAPGTYTIVARATDVDGVESNSTPVIISVLRISLLDATQDSTIGGKEAVFRVKIEYGPLPSGSPINMDRSDLITLKGYEQYTEGTPQQVTITGFIRESRTDEGGLITDIWKCLVDTRFGDSAAVEQDRPTGAGTCVAPMYNSQYNFITIMKFTDNSSDIVYYPKVEDVNVKNIVITSVSPEDYFIVNEGETGPVNFNITLDDYQSNFIYTLTLTIRHTETNTSVIRTITQTGNGLSHTIIWNLMDDDGDPAAPYGGYFTYELEVNKIAPSIDSQIYRSQFLSVLDNDIYFETDTDGLIIRDGSGNVHTFYKYKLSEIPKVNSISIDFFKDGVSVSSIENLSDQNRWDPPNGPVDAWLALDDPPSVRGIITAEDTHENEYRNRTSKRMLCKNRSKAAYTKGSCFTYKLVGELTEPGWLYEWMWVEPGVDPSIHLSWPGNSGNHAWMNSYSEIGYVPVYWLPFDEVTDTGGAIPESNFFHNTVAENRYYDNTGSNCYLLKKHEKIWASSEDFDPSDPHDTATVWRDPANPNSFKQYHDSNAPSDLHVYRKWKIDVCDWDLYRFYIGGAPYYFHRLFGEMQVSGERSGIQIHEDGNYGMTDETGSYTGSIGCIALKPGNMESFWKRFNEVEKAGLSNDNNVGKNLKLQVSEGDYIPSKYAPRLALWGLAPWWTIWGSGNN